MNALYALITTVRLRLILAALVTAVITGVQSVAAQVALTAEISPHSGHTDDLFLFTVTAEGVHATAHPTLSEDQDFERTLIGPRTSISLINGAMSSRVSYVYQLTPKREGTLRTPRATITIDGKTFTAPPIDVVIGAGQVKEAALHNIEGEALLLRQTASPTSVYEGQQIIQTLTVYTRVDLSDLSVEEPSVDGCWQEKIAENQRSSRTVNNIEYTSVEGIKALFPLRSGTITIPARRLKALVPDKRKQESPFGDSFFQQFFEQVQLKPVTVTSNDLLIDVKPLPPIPADLKKAAPPVTIVGPTSIKVSYPLDAINTGETKTIAVEVISEGNLNPLKTLALVAPPRFKVYEERPEVRTDRQSGKLVTHKIFRYSILPLTPGLTRIPGIKLPYFNPVTSTYEVASSSDIAFPVRGEDLSANSTEPVQRTGQDLPSSAVVPTMLPLPIAPPLEYEEPTLIEHLASYVSTQLALLILASICGVGCILLFTAQKKRPEDPKEISTVALQEVRSMRELESFVREVISSRLPRIAENSTMDELRARIASTLSDKNLSLAISSLLDDIEVYNYGGNHTDRDREVPTLKERLGMILMQWRR